MRGIDENYLQIYYLEQDLHYLPSFRYFLQHFFKTQKFPNIKPGVSIISVRSPFKDSNSSKKLYDSHHPMEISKSNSTNIKYILTLPKNVKIS